MVDIYFNANKYKAASRTTTSLKDLQQLGGCHHRRASMIFINVNLLLNGHKHGILDALPDFNAKFNLVVSHEILHAVLLKYIDEEACDKLDNLTVKYWNWNIDINTGYDIIDTQKNETFK